jgi:DNA/RNA-binding domain of Phe-tRNA-synthetase-like protein
LYHRSHSLLVYSDGVTSPAPILPDLDPDLPPLLLGLIRAEPVQVGPSGSALDDEMRETGRTLAARWAGAPPGGIDELAPARRLYRSFGIDPTKFRPSSEALLRRVLKGKPFPRILNAVDICNLCSVRFLLPIGLYDAGRLGRRVTLRRGREGESYEGIRKDRVNLEGRPTLADEDGPFGNPTSDSLRTSVNPGTRSIWMVIFAPEGYSRRDLEGLTAEAAGLLARFLAPGDATVATHTAVIP